MKKVPATLIASTVDEYLAHVPEPARSTLEKVRAIIRSAAPPEAEEVISYRIPMYRYKGMLIGFAAFQNHCSLFLATASLLPQFERELRNYQTAKGTIRFPVDKPPPASLIRKLVKARVAENEGKKKR